MEWTATSQGPVVRIHARGPAVLTNPRTNRGTAFTDTERDALGLTGLLPGGVSTIDAQVRRAYAVTLSVDQVVFREPVHVGELVTLQASVNWTGRTSMEIGVRVTTQDLVQQVVRHTNSCYFTMVAVGPDGRPVPVPPWHPRTAEERRRHDAATRRRELRREIDRVTETIRESTRSGDLASTWPADVRSAEGPPAERGPP